MNDSLAESHAMLKVTWHESGIEIAPETTYSEWQEILRRLMFLREKYPVCNRGCDQFWRA